MTTLAFHQVLGRRVFGVDGRCVGRLEEAPAVREGTRLVVPEFHIGTAAAIQRFAAQLAPLPLVVARGYIARWDQIDWGNPEKPRLRCGVQDLRRFTRRASPRRPGKKDRGGD